MNYIKNFNDYLNESKTQKISVQELKDKYLDNPAGIGANVIEYENDRLILRFEDRWSLNDTKKSLSEMGFPNKKMNTFTLEKGHLYRYELILFQ